MASHPLEPELPATTPNSTARTRLGATKAADGGSGGGLGRGAVLALLVALLAAAGGALYSQPGGREQLQAGLQASLQASNQALANLASAFKFGQKLVARMWLGVPVNFLERLDLPDETLSRLGVQPDQPVDSPPRKQQPREPRVGEVPADSVPRKQQQREQRAGEVPADSVPRKQQQRELRVAEEAAEEAADGTPRRQQRREARSTLLPGDVEPIPQPVPQLPPLPPITQAEIEAFEQVGAGNGRGWRAWHGPPVHVLTAGWNRMAEPLWLQHFYAHRGQLGLAIYVAPSHARVSSAGHC